MILQHFLTATTRTADEELRREGRSNPSARAQDGTARTAEILRRREREVSVEGLFRFLPLLANPPLFHRCRHVADHESRTHSVETRCAGESRHIREGDRSPETGAASFRGTPDVELAQTPRRERTTTHRTRAVGPPPRLQPRAA